MWKEEEPGHQRVSENRIMEAQEDDTEILAVGCPFCKIMLDDASNASGGEVVVRDVVEIIADQVLKKP